MGVPARVTRGPPCATIQLREPGSWRRGRRGGSTDRPATAKLAGYGGLWLVALATLIVALKIPPAPKRHRHDLAAIPARACRDDACHRLFQVDCAVTLQRLGCLFVIEISSRYARVPGVTTNLWGPVNSLMRPPKTVRRLIRSWERSATGWSGRGGRSCRLRWGRRPL